jgi:homopolymeric O-antigen transport system permease protein
MTDVPKTLAAPASHERAAQTVFRVRPSGRGEFNLREVWAFRELLGFLVKRDVKVRYRQTVLGPLWAVIQPLMSMIVFTVIFGHLANIPSEYGVPYPVFVFTGLLPWLYFSSALTACSASVVGNQTLVTKVYFPRLIIPIAAILVPLVDFAIAFLILIAMMAVYGMHPHWHAVFFPIFLLVALTTSLGVGLWLSALNVRFRDIAYGVPFLIQIWLYTSPVIYPVSIIPPRFRWVIALNPMVGVIDGFRWIVLGRGVPAYSVFLTSGAVATLLVISGLMYFKRVERLFADVI